MQRIVALIIVVALLAGCGNTQKEVIEVVTEQSVLTPLEQQLIPELMRRAGLSYRQTVLPWKQAYETAEKKPGTMIYSMARLPSREGKFLWATVITPVTYHLYKLKSREDIKLRRTSDAHSFKIGSFLGGSDELLLRARGVPNQAIIATESRTENAKALFSGKIDLLSGSQLTYLQLCNEFPAQCDMVEVAIDTGDKSEFWIAFNLKTPQTTIDKVQAAYMSMQIDGSWQRILEAFYNQTVREE